MCTHAGFTKSLPGYTPQQVNALYEHALDVWLAFQNRPGVQVAKPLAYTETTIEYEWLQLPPALATMLHSVNSSTLSALHAAGTALAQLHGAFPEKQLLHCDYVPHNLCFDGQALYIIDAHPPELLGYRPDILHGSPDRDILCFISALASGIGFKQAKRRSTDLIHYYKAFFAGYKEVRDIPPTKLATFKQVIRDIATMRSLAGFGKISACMHAVGSCYWIMQSRQAV